MAEFIVGLSDTLAPISFDLVMGNRHGLIAGATGTGKTVTLQRIAEQFANAGVCVFTADVKGDLSGIAMPATDNPKLKQRLADLNITNFTPAGNAVVLWDIFGKNGHPLRTTISEMGPLLLGRLLNLNDTQQGVLNAAVSLADDQGLLLIDLKDLRSVLDWMGNNAATLKAKYGNIASTSLGAIQRGLLTLQEAGGDHFFGEPAFNIQNLFQKDASGKGIIHILDATTLITDPRLYSTFLLWLLSDLFELAPEVGDQDQPKLAFFFDEAHLIFNSAPKPLLEKIEQLVRLIRSKGIGVYFVSQNPLDIPETVLAQLGNRVQHALRAFTPKDQKAVKAAAETFRKNPHVDTTTAICELSVGEALVSFLDNTGTPAMVEKARILPPASRIGPISASERETLLKNSAFAGQYDKAIDRESAYEVLNKSTTPVEAPAQETSKEPAKPVGRPRQTVVEALITSTARSVGSQVGRQIIRGILGSILGGKR